VKIKKFEKASICFVKFDEKFLKKTLKKIKKKQKKVLTKNKEL
jgi:hypothetical protein